jgi:S1-C subfamily serine protease
MFAGYPRIATVAPGGPAARAGIRAGDVLWRVNGQSLLSAEGANAFSRTQPGERLTFTLRRDGAERTVNLRAGECPATGISFGDGSGTCF